MGRDDSPTISCPTIAASPPAPHQIAAPVFVAQGVFDFGAPPLVWAGDKDLLRDCTYHAFARSGHCPHREERDAFDAALLAWLDATAG